MVTFWLFWYTIQLFCIAEGVVRLLKDKDSLYGSALFQFGIAMFVANLMTRFIP